MNGAQIVNAKPPITLEGWHQCAADLQRRHQANHVERDRIVQKRQASALAAARGDGTAQKEIARLAERDANLHLIASSLEQGLAIATQEIDSCEAQVAQENRLDDLAAFQEKLAARLVLVADIEAHVRIMAPLLKRLAAITTEIEREHAVLGGARPILPPLAQETVGGRLAEFMAGCGFADWLPVVRPEIRPAIASWLDAEQIVQQSYQLTA